MENSSVHSNTNQINKIRYINIMYSEKFISKNIDDEIE